MQSSGYVPLSFRERLFFGSWRQFWSNSDSAFGQKNWTSTFLNLLRSSAKPAASSLIQCEAMRTARLRRQTAHGLLSSWHVSTYFICKWPDLLLEHVHAILSQVSLAHVLTVKWFRFDKLWWRFSAEDTMQHVAKQKNVYVCDPGSERWPSRIEIYNSYL